MAKRKRTNNDLRNTKQKMKDRATRTLLIQTTFFVLLKFFFLFFLTIGYIWKRNINITH